MGLSEQIQISMFGKDSFTMQDAYKAVPDKPKTTIRARIYDGLGVRFEKISKGVYKSLDQSCVLIEGNGRKLDMLDDNSVDAIVTDSPWASKSNKGGNRNFADSFDTFEYTVEDFKEKARVLKDGAFLVELLPAENADNYKYLYKIKKMAEQAGFKYYSKVPWIKGNFVSNTGRKAKNSEDILFFTKGEPRKLRIDAKKTKSDAEGIIHYMRGTNGMLPTAFNVEPVPIKKRIHQSEKPVKLWEQILNFISLKGEFIVDQFAGSGSVGEAIKNTGRIGLLIEKLHENVVKICNRLNMEPIPEY